ncbi:MAG: MBOAT family protein [Oscillospiraceae bacterium]|nr:MBOAT family protein [Oscillospiraceae bacterium]
MLFSSLPFLFAFLPLFFMIYFIVKKRTVRNLVLLIFSLIFYAWGEPVYVFLMLFSILCDYIFGYCVSKYIALEDKKTARRFVIASISLNLFVLGIFKYADFFISNLKFIPGLENLEPLGLALPIGISFYTFQTMSYTIDIYRGHATMQKNITSFGAYVAAFPQLVAGPIVRYHTVSEQLRERSETFENFASGLRRFIAGMAKKILIANNAAALADGVLAMHGSEYGALGAWLAIIAYSLQIYFDFSGYSDMAIGLAKMMGFTYLENFNYPYISKSISEFWRRWHISLGTFFRDYLYIPLGGNRVSVPRWILNIMVVWLLTGLWHGAAWNFILWGVYFGLLLLAERFLLRNNILKTPVINRVYTIAAFMFGWVIFRAESVAHIGEITASMLGFNGAGSFVMLAENEIVQLPYLIAVIAGIICSMPVSRYVKKFLEGSPVGEAVIDISALLALTYCIFSLVVGSYNPFIYFIF